MQSPRYALVAYVHNAIGEFVESLRRELHPDLPLLPAHLTILPPRSLEGSELSALELLEDACTAVKPFEVILGDAQTFVPVTPTVYIAIEGGAHHLHGLHQRLNTQVLKAVEEWPYVPHLTIAKMTTDPLAQSAYLTARDRWAQFQGGRSILVNELTFVREMEPDHWVDLAELPLGRSLVKG